MATRDSVLGGNGKWRLLAARKRICLGAVALACLIFLAACGQDSDGSEAYFDIRTETEQLFAPGESDFNSFLLGMQFFRGEPVQLWAQRVTDDRLQATLDVYLQKKDGGRELLLAGMDTGYRVSGWYLGQDGSFYIPYLGELIRLDSEGKQLSSVGIGGNVCGICQADSKTLALLVSDGLNYTLSRLDIDTGRLSGVGESENSPKSGELYLGGGGGETLLLNGEGIWRVDLRTGEKTAVLAFKGTSYAPDFSGGARVTAFRMSREDTAELLYEDGRLERLRFEDVSADRTVIRIRTGDTYLLGWLRQQTVRYNTQNDTYYIFIECRDENFDVWDFRDQTFVQMAAGKGADIICGSAVLLNATDLLDKGGFEELSSYIRASGIREEEYFPMVFDSWRDGDKIYSVNPVVNLAGGYAVDKSLLQGGEPTLEEFLDILLGTEKKAVLSEGMTASSVLRYFLRGSEDLWGMIDWERGTCDFEGELFGKLLEAAGKLGDSETSHYPEIMTYRSDFLYGFLTEEELERDGKEAIGYFFDGGCGMGVAQNYVLAMNAKSPNKEGAWEFMAYLLSEEAQRDFDYHDFAMNRRAFDAMVEREIAVGAKETTIVNGRAHTRHKGGRGMEDITQEKAEELKREIESARAFPVRTEPILDIICEEAGGYFDGGKSIEETCRIIENRVNLYLSERR